MDIAVWILQALWGLHWYLLGIFAVLFLWGGGYRLLGVVVIPDDKIGIVTKKFALLGATRLPDGAIVALKGEAGLQADTLAPGLYFWFWPWQYSIEIEEFTEVSTGHVGIVEAYGGQPIPAGRVLGGRVDCNSFQDSRKFLEGGGQRGPQMAILPAGIYRINTQIFHVEEVEVKTVPQGKVGIVTTLEGKPLASGEIAGPEIGGHSSFQDGDAFIDGGGTKGIQEQVIQAGTYFLNPRFVNVDLVEMTDVPIGYVGVVVSYVGAVGTDTSGPTFTHGNIVGKGEKGVWATPLDPGRYPVNTRVMKVESVPTTNIVLNWATGKSEAHMLDKNLSTITVRSGDGFTFNLDVSQIIHVSRENAPKVIARFGTMVNLVTQVLEPTIGNYFRNSAQESDVIAFLKSRSQRQKEAAGFIHEALDKYNVEAVDTLIGDISPPEKLMETLTDRKVAEQRKVTFETQQKAEEQRQEFEKAKSEADTRGQVVAASRAAEVAKLTAEATVSKARGEAEAKTVNAQADAGVLKMIGDATAGKTLVIGTAEADVLKSKVDAVGAQFYALMNVVEGLAVNHVPLVPQIVAGGDGTKGSGLIDAFIGNLLAQQTKGSHNETNDTTRTR